MIYLNKIIQTITVLLFSTTILAKNFSLEDISPEKPLDFNNQISSSKTFIKETKWKLNSQNIKQLIQAKKSITISNFPLDAITISNKTINKNIVLKQYDIFAKNAKIYRATSTEKTELKRPNLIAYSSITDGVALVVNPLTGETQGFYNNAGTSLEIIGNIKTTLLLKATQEQTQDTNVTKQCSTQMGNQPTLSSHDFKNNPMQVRNTPAGGINYQAVIAVDTDNEWMTGKANNTTTAMTYITNLFVNMNVFYERDFATRLLIGDTFLRTAPDPYPTQANIINSLTDFGEFWRVNQSVVVRDFALILSGQNINSNGYSGIAWVNLLCNKGIRQGSQTQGSYSINRIGSNLNVSFVSQFVGHELGHNFGSPHTHCYNTPLDQCYSAEAGCYSGSTSCPASGKGTIMSYCHFNGANDANCGINNEIFHPTVITQITVNIATNSSASCLVPFVDPSIVTIFNNGFEN